MRIILLVHTSLIMRMQACSCVHEPLPENPNFYLFVLLLPLHVVLFRVS